MAAAIALLALSPNTALTTAYTTLIPALTADLHASERTLQVAEGLSNAGLAVGAVVAAYLGQRHVQRYLFIGYQVMFAAASLAATMAPSVEVFAAGRVLQGLATGIMIIGALPVLVTRFGVARLPVSVAVVNVALFGSATLGPLMAGPVAASGSWRLLFGALAAAGLVGLLVTLLGYERFDPPDPRLRLDRSAMVLAVLATVLPFYATSVLATDGAGSPSFVLPFAAGLLSLVALVVTEYRVADPMVPVRALSTQLPVTGTIVAMLGGAVFVAVLSLAQLLLSDVAGLAPEPAATLFWPMPVGLLVAAVLFGVIFRTRWLPVLVNVGLVSLGCAALALCFRRRAPGAARPRGGGGSGLRRRCQRLPGLFLAAMGVPSSRLGRAFALVLLLRAEAAYAVAPIVMYVAESASDLREGIRLGLILMVALAAMGVLAALVIPAASGARLRPPDLVAWLEEGRTALPSPTTAVHARPGRRDEEAAPLLPRRLVRRGRR